MASVGVIVAGTLIILYDWRFVDPLVTILIAAYILWHAFAEIGGSIRMLMLGTPPDIDARKVVEALRGVDGIEDVHHVHLWAIDEEYNALEAHVVVADETGVGSQAVKERIKAMARERFGIGHTTLELEASLGPARTPGPSAIESPRHILTTTMNTAKRRRSMFEVMPESSPDLLTIRVSGALDKDDYARLHPWLDARLKERSCPALLVVMEDFHGWESVGALVEDAKIDMAHHEDLSRIAMVGDRSWQKWMTWITVPFVKAEYPLVRPLRTRCRARMGARCR